ncbi:MAG TPA: NADH-quinone oxidoreductase subunit NuoH [Chloroflexia bacterium]|nr:NADH-quinone oxidoreductase subunit NuoH [Chloroflexia bacterium]
MDNFDWVWILIRIIVASVILTIVLVTMGFLTYFERKVAAHMQQRQGPNRTGFLGLAQWLADAVKLIHKEEIIPAGADKVIFWIAPMLSMFTASAAYAFVPFGEQITLFGRTIPYYISETPVGLIALLAFSSLGVYGLIMGSWSSNNKYALLGGLRSSAQVISYEVTMGISLVGVMMLAQSLSLNDIARAQGGSWVGGFAGSLLGTPGVWFILLQPVAFLTYMTSAIAETNRAPFDLPEAESELVGGYHVEFSAMHFGLYFLAEYINMITVSAIATYCFLGGWQPIIPIGGAALGPLWFVIKMAGFIFFYYWLRWTVPRFRYDQLMGICWKGMLPIVLINILVVALLRTFVAFMQPDPDVTSIPPLLTGAPLEQTWPWLVFIAVQLVLAVAFVVLVSRAAVGTWWGKSDRPLLARAGDTNPAAIGAVLDTDAARRIELRPGL